MKHAIRVLSREKAFAVFAVLILAFGIGAVSTLFSVVDGVLLQPLAYTDPGRLYAIAESAPQIAKAYPKLPLNSAHFHYWLEQCRSCQQAALVQPASFTLTGQGEPERIEGAACTWQLFHVLGIRPQLGRTFLESDDRPSDNQYIVITDALWRRRLNADPNAVGKSLNLYGKPHVIVGVLPADFRFPSAAQLGSVILYPAHAEIFKPLGIDWPKQRPTEGFNYSGVVRLRPGATQAAAQAEMTAAVAEAGRLMKTELKALLTPLHEQVTGSSRDALLLLFGAVCAVLLIVCVNVGNLMLVRAGGRLREAAIRRALGAGTFQLLRPLLAESLLLAFAGGALGVVLANVGVRLLAVAAPIDIPRMDEVRVNAATLLFSFGASALCGILCGLWPALGLTRSEAADAFKGGARGGTETLAKLRAREWLVGFEVALSTVLVASAALLGVSFLEVLNVRRGFESGRVLTADLTLPDSRYHTDELKAGFDRQIIDRLESLPGVESAALISSLPLAAQSWGDMISREGDTRPMLERPLANFRFVSPHYFAAMGIALRSGRAIAESDRSHRVAVISHSAALRAFPGEDPVGKRIRNGDARKDWVDVIGVVDDVRSESLEKQPPLIVYVPYWEGKYWQGGVWGNLTYLIRTTREPEAMAGAFRRAVHELDAELPVANLRTMEQIVSGSVGRRRFQTLLAGGFGLAALLLACLGIYGVISYTVTRRTNELGIRMALGARAGEVALMVLRQGMAPVIGGLLTGVAVALWSAGLLAGMVYGIGARDPRTIGAVAALLLAVAAAACWIPARRASRIDPAGALRYE
jgi:putative ABC transport system permease protein